jgi:four helix bundle protein
MAEGRNLRAHRPGPEVLPIDWRPIGANLSEAWAKRANPAHFLSKLTDADAELADTRHWIATAIACSYLTEEQQATLSELAGTVGG